MDVVGDDERHDVLAAVGWFAVLVFDEFRQSPRVADVSKHLQTVGLANHGSRTRQEVSTRNVVVDTTDDRTAVSRGQDVLLDTHQDLRFSPSLLGLYHVQVHFIAVEVSVVRRTNGQVEPERVSLHDANFVHHHRHSVQGRLSVEDDDVAVDQVALNLQTGLGVAVSVQRGQSVLNTGSLFAPLIERAATVGADHLKVFWERFGVRVVGLSQFMHPSVVEDGPRVVGIEVSSVFIEALKVVQRRRVVDDVAHFFLLVHAAQSNLLLHDDAGKEVGSGHDLMEVGACAVIVAVRVNATLRVVAPESCVDESASCVDFDATAIAADDVVDTGMDVGSTKNHLSHLLSISRRDTNGDRQLLGDLGRNADFVDAEVGVG